MRKSMAVFQACLCIFLSLLFSCSSSSGGNSEGGNGSIAFSLQADPDGFSGSSYAKAEAGPSGSVRGEAILDCEGLGIVSVEAYVYDENDVLIARGGPWPCTVGEGIIYGVRQGPNRTVLVFLKNGSNQVSYSGRRSALTIVAGQTTDAGVIELIPEPEEENQPPIASDDSATVHHSGTVTLLDSGHTSLLHNDIDPDGQGLTVDTSPVSGPGHGTLTLREDGTFSYTHTDPDSTADSFTYRVSDGHGGWDDAAVHITVTQAPNAAPALVGGTVYPGEGNTGTAYTYSVGYEDPDGDAPEFVHVFIDGEPFPMERSSGSDADGTYRFTTTLAQGEHNYSFSCSDGHGGSAVFPASGSCTGPFVSQEITYPAASDDQARVYGGGQVSILDSGSTSLLANDTPGPGTSLTMSTDPVVDPAHGRLALRQDGTFTYYHLGDGSTEDSFVYRVFDGSERWDDATVHITVLPGENSSPTLSEGYVSPASGDTATEFTYTVYYFDADGHRPAAIDVLIDKEPRAMELLEGEPHAGVYRYRTTLPGGTDHTYAFSCSDGYGGFDSTGTAEGPFVDPENHDPSASDDRMVVGCGKTAAFLESGFSSLLANDSDPDGDDLTVDTVPVAGPSHGSLSLNDDGTFSYTHQGRDCTVNDSFTYRVRDSHGNTDTAIVGITVLPGGSDPVLSDPEVSPGRGDTKTVFTFSVRYFDPDFDEMLLGYAVIGGIPHAMSPSPGMIGNGNGLYVCSATLPPGPLEYCFLFTDSGGGSCRYPEYGSLRAPDVVESLSRYYVSPSGRDDPGAGTIPDPFRTIRYALDVARETADGPIVIHIAAGDYAENIELGPWETLEGGWNSSFSRRWDFRGEWPPPYADPEEFSLYETAVLGSGSGRFITIDHAEEVVIDGLTLWSDPGSDDAMGGIDVVGCSPEIVNCRIENGRSPVGANGAFGGGMFVSGGSPLIRRCVFSGNHAGGSENCSGGGLYNLSSSPVIVDCIFTENRAGCTTGSGGAIYNMESSPTILNCFFSGNSACGSYALGGAVCNNGQNNGAPPVLLNCVFTQNLAQGTVYGKGGAVYNQSGSPIITNCSFTLNSALSDSGHGKAGGIYNESSASASITNCILWGNTATYTYYKEIYSNPSCSITYSDIEQAEFAGYKQENISTDPGFQGNVPPEPGDPPLEPGELRLAPGSPCIDSGTRDIDPCPETDYAGTPRVLGPMTDMGAFESW